MGWFSRGKDEKKQDAAQGIEPAAQQAAQPVQPKSEPVRTVPVEVETPKQEPEPIPEDVLVRTQFQRHWDWWLAYRRSSDEKQLFVSKLAELIQEHFPDREPIHILDVGSGEGSLVISLVHELIPSYPEIQVDCLEQSSTLFRMLKNKLLGSPLQSKTTPYQGQFETFTPDLKYDVVLALNSVAGMDPAGEPLEKLFAATSSSGLLILSAQSESGPYLQIQQTLAKQPIMTAESLRLLISKLNRWVAEERVAATLLLGIQPDGTDTRVQNLSLLLREPFETASSERRGQLMDLLKQHTKPAPQGKELEIANMLFVVKPGLPRQPPEPEPQTRTEPEPEEHAEPGSEQDPTISELRQEQPLAAELVELPEDLPESTTDENLEKATDEILEKIATASIDDPVTEEIISETPEPDPAIVAEIQEEIEKLDADPDTATANQEKKKEDEDE